MTLINPVSVDNFKAIKEDLELLWNDLPALPTIPFAVYSAGNNSLKFYNRPTVPTVGSTFEGASVDEVYTNLDSIASEDGSDIPWKSHVATLQTVETVDEVAPTNTAYWFYQGGNLTTCNLSKLNTSNVTSMYAMFAGCSKLTSITGIENFDTSNVTTLGSTFALCQALTSLDLSNWNTNKVTVLYGTFNSCYALTSLDVSTWDTSNVTNMSSVFYDCKTLPHVDTSNWNTSKVTTMANMFSRCNKLEEVQVSNFDTSNVTDLSTMFNGCQLVTEIPCSNWNVEKVTTLYGTFFGCMKLEALDLTTWHTPVLTNLEKTFYNNQELRTLHMDNLDTTNVTTYANLFDLVTHHIVTFSIGDNWTINFGDAKLVSPSAGNGGGDGKWYDQATGVGYAPANIPVRHAATYSRNKPTA